MNWPDDYINKVICGDCLDIMQGIPDGAVDLVLTDPPYGMLDGRGKVQIKAGHIVDCYTGEWDRQLPLKWIADGVRMLRDGSWFCSFTDRLSVKEVWDQFELHGGRGKEVFFWTKTTCPPQPRKNFCSAVEVAMVGTRGAVKKWNGGGVTRNYINGNNASFDDSTGHPTQKPVWLMSKLISVMSDFSDLILDPFCGSGTTCVAAKQLGRKYIGIEISPEYCKIAEDRLRQEELF